MARAVYVGMGAVVHRTKGFYIGVNGVARRVIKAYIGVGGVARPFFIDERTRSAEPTSTGGSDQPNITETGTQNATEG